MPDPAPRIFHVPRVTRNQVTVKVGHRLAGYFAAVHADVIAGGLVLLLHQLLGLGQHQRQVPLLVEGEGEVIRPHLVGDDQRVTRRNGVQIPNDEKQRIPVKNALGGQVQKDAHG